MPGKLIKVSIQHNLAGFVALNLESWGCIEHENIKIYKDSFAFD